MMMMTMILQKLKTRGPTQAGQELESMGKAMGEPSTGLAKALSVKYLFSIGKKPRNFDSETDRENLEGRRDAPPHRFLRPVTIWHVMKTILVHWDLSESWAGVRTGGASPALTVSSSRKPSRLKPASKASQVLTTREPRPRESAGGWGMLSEAGL